MDVHTRRLRHFVTLADELHFTRAADRLHLSQQGISRSIRELEQLVGAPLAHPTTRTVVLTKAGQAFLRALPDALAALDSAAEAARRAHAEVSGVLGPPLLVEPRAIGVARSHHLAETGPVQVRQLAGEAIMADAPRTKHGPPSGRSATPS